MGKRTVLFAGAAVVAAGIGVGGMATANGTRDRFHVSLRGVFENPPADPDGRATARVDLDIKDNTVCWSLKYDDIGTPTLAHIHGPALTTGNAPVVVGFIDAGHPFTDVDQLERGRAEGCTTDADPAKVAAIIENPELYYVNIHNSRFPAGAVRGQMG
jgi:hypothetical protein